MIPIANPITMALTRFCIGNTRASAVIASSLIFAIEHKKQLCLANGIALWDIVESCDIVGSADANIKNYRFVDLYWLLKNTNVCKILCNGTTAYKFTTAAYHGDLPVVLLPSTSPANTRFDKEIWTKELSVLITE